MTPEIVSYINNFPEEVKAKLNYICTTILNISPQITMAIKYKMPTFIYKGKNLVHVAGYKNHIGFYPTPEPIEEFSTELEQFKTSKGAVQFPHDKDLPIDLFVKITKWRMKEIDSNK